MRPSPPEQLVALLEGIGLPAAGRIGRVAGRIARLAKDLPVFESVWIDELARAEYLTPMQAAEIRAGRGRQLRRGNYLIEAELPSDGLVRWFRARSTTRRRTVRLATFSVDSDRADPIAAKLKKLIATLKSLDPPVATRPIALGVERIATDDGAEDSTAATRRMWLAANYQPATTARRWMTQCGRFPIETVVALARQTAAELAALHGCGVLHGDLSAGNLLLTARGTGALIGPGIRPIIRPEEGLAHADLPPCCYDYLAPERIRDGLPATIATDIFALGCLWWHLLCGRPPFLGGTAEDKIRAARHCEVPDPRQQVPQVPDALRDAIRQATDPDPERRPRSADALVQWLGRPARRDRRCVARSVRNPRPNLTDGWTRHYVGSDDSTASTRSDSRGRFRSLLGLSILLTAVCLLAINLAAPETFQLARTLLDRFSATETTTEPPPTPTEPPNVDRPAVDPVAPPEPVVNSDTNIEPAGDATDDLILDSTGPIVIDRLQLRPGRTVRGPVGGRAVLIVPAAGLLIDVEDVRFENIDFVAPDGVVTDALIRLAADQVRFTGCGFRASEASVYPPLAIRWTGPITADSNDASLPSGRITMIDCLFERISTAVELDAPGDRGLHFLQTVHEGFGPLVRIDRPLAADAMISIHLTQSRLERSGPLLQIQLEEEAAGRILIRTDQCSLRCRKGVGILEFRGPIDPAPMLRELRWVGRETTIDLDATVATWEDRPLDDSTIAIEGVIRADPPTEQPEDGSDAL